MKQQKKMNLRALRVAHVNADITVTRDPQATETEIEITDRGGYLNLCTWQKSDGVLVITGPESSERRLTGSIDFNIFGRRLKSYDAANPAAKAEISVEIKAPESLGVTLVQVVGTCIDITGQQQFPPVPETSSPHKKGTVLVFGKISRTQLVWAVSAVTGAIIAMLKWLLL